MHVWNWSQLIHRHFSNCIVQSSTTLNLQDVHAPILKEVFLELQDVTEMVQC